MSDLKIGLVGHADGTTIGVLAQALWRELPFHSWLVPTQKDGSFDRQIVGRDHKNRTIYVLNGCSKVTSRAFLAGLDRVFSIQRTWPDHLFYYAKHYFGASTVLLAHEEKDHDPDQYWIKYADRIMAPSEAAHERLCFLGQTEKLDRHCWPRNSGDLRSLWERIGG